MSLSPLGRGGAAWTMADERRFILGLGGWGTGGLRLPRTVLLRGYLAGLTRRTEWGELEERDLRAAVRVELQRQGVV